MKMYKPPEYQEIDQFCVFMAGSIEMGVAENWQDRLANMLKTDPVTFFNPRRDDWDSSWKQSITDLNFNTQVNWELYHISKANIVVFYFDPKTMSPITLMELGLVAGKNLHAVVCCPDGFWRKGNVEIICENYDISMVKTLEDVANYIRAYIW